MSTEKTEKRSGVSLRFAVIATVFIVISALLFMYFDSQKWFYPPLFLPLIWGTYFLKRKPQKAQTWGDELREEHGVEEVKASDAPEEQPPSKAPAVIAMIVIIVVFTSLFSALFLIFSSDDEEKEQPVKEEVKEEETGSSLDSVQKELEGTRWWACFGDYKELGFPSYQACWKNEKPAPAHEPATPAEEHADLERKYMPAVFNELSISVQEEPIFKEHNAFIKLMVKPLRDMRGVVVGNEVDIAVHPVADYGNAVSSLIKRANNWSAFKAIPADGNTYVIYMDSDGARAADSEINPRTLIKTYHCQSLAKWVVENGHKAEKFHQGMALNAVMSSLIWQTELATGHSVVDFNGRKDQVTVSLGKGNSSVSVSYDLRPPCQKL